jgi:hypothetical protein
MADIVKKVVVENVPKIYGSGYTIRYRIISEDRNRTSQWSPMHTFEKDVPVDPPTSVDGEIIFVSARQVSATWAETNANSIYEVFIKWDYDAFYADDNTGNDPDPNLYEDENLGWKYVRTVSTPNYSTLVPIDPSTSLPAQSVKIWVQQPTSNQIQEPFALIFTGEDTFTS